MLKDLHIYKAWNDISAEENESITKVADLKMQRLN